MDAHKYVAGAGGWESREAETLGCAGMDKRTNV